MGWESCDVFRFDIGSLLQNQTRVDKLKSASLLYIDFWDMKATYGLSWAWNFPMWPDLALDPSFKVK